MRFGRVLRIKKFGDSLKSPNRGMDALIIKVISISLNPSSPRGILKVYL